MTTDKERTLIRGPRRVHRAKLSDQIADDLRHWIARERLKPGDRLPNEKALIQHYGCAKGTLREALKGLEVQGLVKMQTGPNGGAEIQLVSIEAAMQQLRSYLHFQVLDFEQIYVVRRTLEVALAESVVGRLTEDQFTRLETNIHECIEARYRGDRTTGRRLEIEFHDILCESSNNPLLAFMCRFLNGLLRDLVEFRSDCYDEHEAFGQHNVGSHRELVAAFRAKDRRAVSRIMREHMCCAESFMKRLDAAFRSDLLSAG
ncbi:FadR/GntR family transcriptional regulator [Microvirga aerilata]|uniref:FadR/GntR family transcriptional regulator n=1 Tax=Microvirga aerilata TaxID=670292 RepID=UPI0028B1596D|nr:FCD domain-containing protein [Microvirga aerilata]